MLGVDTCPKCWVVQSDISTELTDVGDSNGGDCVDQAVFEGDGKCRHELLDPWLSCVPEDHGEELVGQRVNPRCLFHSLYVKRRLLVDPICTCIL